MKLKLTNSNNKTYLKKLEGRIFKILPVFEGKDAKTKEVVLSKERAYKDYLTYVGKLECSMKGFSNNIDENEFLYDMDIFREIIFNVSGLKSTVMHKEIKSIVLSSIKLLNKVDRSG